MKPQKPFTLNDTIAICALGEGIGLLVRYMAEGKGVHGFPAG
jgi:hypothetical protein